MKKIISLILLIILCVSCSSISNTPIEKIDDNMIINYFNMSAINGNSNQIATDGKQIYYINPENNFIYKINLDGTSNELISEHKSTKLIYYKEKLYFFNYNQGISCIDMDGSNYQVIYHNNEKPTNNFIIYDDVIYMTVFAEEQDAGYMFGFYKYYLADGRMEKFDDRIALPHSLGLCLINDKIYYNISGKTCEYDTKANTVKDYDASIYNMQEYNSYVYSFSNNYIMKGEFDNIGGFSKIYEISDDYIIKRISVINDLIIIIYIHDYSEEEKKVGYIDVINLEENNRKQIFEFKYSTLGHYTFEHIFILNDKIIFVSKDQEYMIFKILDFKGNEVWSLY